MALSHLEGFTATIDTLKNIGIATFAQYGTFAEAF